MSRLVLFFAMVLGMGIFAFGADNEPIAEILPTGKGPNIILFYARTKDGAHAKDIAEKIRVQTEKVFVIGCHGDGKGLHLDGSPLAVEALASYLVQVPQIRSGQVRLLYLHACCAGQNTFEGAPSVELLRALDKLRPDLSLKILAANGVLDTFAGSSDNFILSVKTEKSVLAHKKDPRVPEERVPYTEAFSLAMIVRGEVTLHPLSGGGVAEFLQAGFDYGPKNRVIYLADGEGRAPREIRAYDRDYSRADARALEILNLAISPTTAEGCVRNLVSVNP